MPVIEAAKRYAPRAPRAWGAAVLALLAALEGGCGFSTSPRPLAQLIVAPQHVRVWLRDGQVVVAWNLPSEAMQRRWRGLDAFHLSLVRLPLGCPDCRPLARSELVLNVGSERLMTSGGTALYQFVPTGPPATWLVQVAVEFEGGTSLAAPPEFVDAVGSIPAETLHWERVGPQTLGAGGKPAIRLYWQPRRERIVHVVTPQAGQVDSNLLYRVNLYRRVPPEPWPPLPFNATPIQELSWIGPEPYLVNAIGAETVEFGMRLVDEFGNEGPISQPVAVSTAKGPDL